MSPHPHSRSNNSLDLGEKYILRLLVNTPLLSTEGIASIEMGKNSSFPLLGSVAGACELN